MYRKLKNLAYIFFGIVLNMALFAPIAIAEDEIAFDYADVWLNPAWYLPRDIVPRGTDVDDYWDQWRKYPKRIDVSSFFNRVEVDDQSCKYEELGVLPAEIGAGRQPTLSIDCDGYKPFLMQRHQTERGRHKPHFINVKFGDTGKTSSKGFPLDLVGYYRESYFLEMMKKYELEKRKEDPELKDWGTE